MGNSKTWSPINPEYSNLEIPSGNVSAEGGLKPFQQPSQPFVPLPSKPAADVPAYPFAGQPSAAPAPAQPLPGDWSLQSPGDAENFWKMVQGQFLLPTLGEAFASSIVPGITAPGAGQQYWENFGSGLTGNATSAGNASMQAYRDFAGRRPDLMSDPGLGGYYDNAKRRALESIGQQSAAAGGYGSSVAQDVGAETVMNLEAERANREADYALRRAAEDRAYGTAAMMGAGQADQNQLGWATGLGKLAMGAEEAGLAREIGAIAAARGLGHDQLNRIIGGMNAATTAQNAREGRIGGAYDDIFKMGLGASGIAGGAYDSALDGVMSFEDAIIQALTGGKTAGVRESESDQNQNSAGLRDFLAAWSALYGVPGAGGGGGGGVESAPQRPAPTVTDPSAPGFWSQPF